MWWCFDGVDVDCAIGAAEIFVESDEGLSYGRHLGLRDVSVNAEDCDACPDYDYDHS